VRKYLQSLNFHSWFKRITLEAGAEKSYKELWEKHFEAEKAKKKTSEDADSAKESERKLDKQMAIIIDGIIARHSRNIGRYDAILVDEGQDLNPSWWNCLRKLLIPGGEMLLVADESQDIYEKSALWTEDSMKGCSLSPQWVRLENSYRIPNVLIPILKDFADRFIPEKQVDLPQEEDEFFSANLRWRQTTSPNIVTAAFEEVVAMAGIKLPSIVPFADVTIAVSNKALGIGLIKRLAAENIKVIHTFDLQTDSNRGVKADKRKERRKKLFFYKGDARIKITTIHSLKGLESRSLILCLEGLDPCLSGKLLYTGMTRLKRSDEGSHLTVVSSVNELINHGSTWPKYQNDTHQ
jgi:superfamily I DNA/RNA helicase